MASQALQRWISTGLKNLDELEQVHADAKGVGPGRKWGTEQLNRSLFVALVAQFQAYCRGVHDEAVEVQFLNANPQQSDMIRKLLTQGRRLDKMNPRSDHLGSDFGRLGIAIVDALNVKGASFREDVRLLDVLVDFRNAIVHGNETEVTSIIGTGDIKATKTVYKAYRKTVDRLATTMDEVVAARLGSILGVEPPW